MDKCFMNIEAMYRSHSDSENDRWHWDYATGLWDPVLGIPNVRMAGDLARENCRGVRYPGGNENRIFTLANALSGMFTIDSLITCCIAIGGTPVINITVFQPISEAIAIIKHIRDQGYLGLLWIEIGNESYLGKEKNEHGRWPCDYPAKDYAHFVNKFRHDLAASGNADDNLKFMILTPQPGWTHPVFPNWAQEAKDAINPAAYDAVATHLYYSIFTQGGNKVALEMCHEMFPDRLIHVTEWNMNNGHDHGPVGHGSEQHFTYCYNQVKLFEETDYVEGHYYWEAGAYWKMWEKDGTPLKQWEAFKLL